eukprot:gene7980-12446_t
MGIRQPSGARKPTISGISSDFGTYHPIWLGALDSTTPTIIGNVEASDATSVSAKLYVDGNSFTTGYAGAFTSQVYGVNYNTGQIVSESSLVVRKNGANGHVLTSEVAPSSSYNHFVQPKTGTLCDVDQRIINMGLAADFNTSSGSYVRAINFLYGGTDNLGDFMTNLFVAYTASGGFLVSIRLQDVTNSQTIAESASFASGGSNQILTLSSFSNIPTGPAIFELQCSTQTAPDITIHSASLQ